MENKIKLEPGVYCVACLRNSSQVLSEHEIQFQIMSEYKDLVKDHLTNLETPIEICIECIEKLKSIIEFKDKCIKSIKQLNSTTTAIIGEISEDANINTILSTSVKHEFTVFVEDLHIKPEIPVKRKQLSIKPKRTKKFELKLDENEPAVQYPDKSKFPSIKGYCSICCYDQKNLHKHAVDMHSRSTDNDGSLKCALCEENCSEITVLLKHLEEKHEEYEHPRKCRKCDMTTKYRKEFVQHVAMCLYNNEKRAYPCNFCDDIFCREMKLRYHSQVHFGALRCGYCVKTFFGKHEHALHVNEHRKRRENIAYICDTCGLKRKSKHSLLLHMLTLHFTSVEAGFRCDQCVKAFKTERQLLDHLKCHKTKKDQCNYCGNYYSKKSHLDRHIAVKHLKIPQKPNKKQVKPKPQTRDFACHQCDMKFFRKAALDKHQYSHSKTRPYNCTLCPTGYYMNLYLKNHYLREHGLEYTSKQVRALCGRKFIGEEFD